MHELVRQASVVEGERLREARVDLAFDDHVVGGLALLVVGEMGALEALLLGPEVAQVDVAVVAGGTGADDDHAAGLAGENRSWDRVLAGVLEDDARAAALAQRVINGA